MSAATIGVALLVLLSSLGITAATPVVVKRPPFVGALPYDHIQFRTAFGCTSFAHDPIPGSFNATSGLARVYSKAGVHACAGSSVRTTLLGYVGASNISIHVAASGRYNVSAYWSVLAGVAFSVFFNGSPSTNLGAGSSLVPNICMFDLTAGNSSCKGAHAFGSVSSSTNLSQNISSSFAEIVAWYLASGHSYALETFVAYFVYGWAYSTAGIGSSITVALDMHSPGFGATLRSVTVAK